MEKKELSEKNQSILRWLKKHMQTPNTKKDEAFWKEYDRFQKEHPFCLTRSHKLCEKKKQFDFEIEKRFVLSAEQITSIVSNGKYVGKKQKDETYFDTEKLDLFNQTLFLRQNDRGNFVLKFPVEDCKTGDTSKFNEIDDFKTICKFLGLKHTSDIDDPINILKASGFNKLCRILNNRTIYNIDDITFCIDECKIISLRQDSAKKNLHYCVCEAEIVVESLSEISIANTKLDKFKLDFNLPEETKQGKVQYYVGIALAHLIKTTTV